MKIDDSINGVPAIRNRETRKQKGHAPAPATTPGQAGDSIEITPASAQLSQLEAELGLLDSTDTAKVAAVRQAIEEGRFQVDEEAVADALLQSTMAQLRQHGKNK